MRGAVGRTDSSIELRITSQLERCLSRMAIDRTDMIRMLEEHKDMVVSMEAKRMAQYVQDTQRITDHITALEHFIVNEMKHVVNNMQVNTSYVST